MQKNDLIKNFDEFKEEFKNYIDKELDYRRLKAVEKLSKFSSSVISKLIILYLLLFILLFASIAAAFYLGNIFNSTSLGFVSIAGFYLIVLLIIILLKPVIIEKPIIKSFIKLFFQKDDE